MSSRDWSLTVFVACVIAAIALYFTTHIASAVLVFVAVLALSAAIFDPWLKRRVYARWVKPKPDLKVAN